MGGEGEVIVGAWRCGVIVGAWRCGVCGVLEGREGTGGKMGRYLYGRARVAAAAARDVLM